MNKDQLLALASERVQAVTRGDLDAIMATLSPEPIFDLYPLGLRLSGYQNVRRYYEWTIHHFNTRVTPTLVGAYVAETDIAWEFDLLYRPQQGPSELFRVLAVVPAAGDRLAGERLFGSERCLRLMLGEEAWGKLVPIRN